MVNNILDADNFNDNIEYVQLIRKYAIIITCFILVEVSITTAAPFSMHELGKILNLEEYFYLNSLFYLPRYLINIVSAIIVYGDMKKTNNKSSAIIVLTCLFNELGVCFFLISLLYRELSIKINTKNK